MATQGQLRLEERLKEIERKLHLQNIRLNALHTLMERYHGTDNAESVPVERQESLESGPAEEEADEPDKKLRRRGREILSTKSAPGAGSA